MAGRPVAGDCRSAGPGKSGHDPPLRRSLRSRRHTARRRHGQPIQLQSNPRLCGISIPAPHRPDKAARILGQMRELGVRLIATSSHKGTPLDQAMLTGPLAIFIGSEGAGLPRELLTQMTDTVAIPHSPNVESLNAGVAASIVLYEAARQATHHRDIESQRTQT
jgi:hypothetical protein